VDRYVHVSQTFGDNAQPEDLLAAIPSIGAGSKATS
jgi:hypothetical protein